jgi:beta-phosphoglucomutase
LPKKINIKAILFDMDGVIIDSMPYHFIAWYEALMSYGIRVSCFDIFMREGENWKISVSELFSRSGIGSTDKLLKEIFLSRQKIFKKYFKRFIFDGAVELIDRLNGRGYPLALVTGTPRKDVKKILPKNILSKFDVVVGGDCVRRGKPYPDPYLAAAKLLGVKPCNCFVVENAPLGILSAKRAKMYVAAITTSLPREYLRASDIVVNNFVELTRFLPLD